MDTYTDQLYRHGVKGMRWGVKKARYTNVSTDGSKKRKYEDAKKQFEAAKRNKKEANKKLNKAYRTANSRVLNYLEGPIGKTKREADMMKKAEDANKADKRYKAAKVAVKAAKKMANLEAKAVKEKYREQYMNGKSAAAKAIAKLTDGDRIYADTMYGLNNGVYKK